MFPHDVAASPYALTLLWTAPGDDADTGRSSRYDLRYSTSAVGADTLQWWSLARGAPNLPRPSYSGQEDSTLVQGLNPETTYSFVLRTFDEAGNVSGFSNVCVATTDPAVPAGSPGSLASAGGTAPAIHAYPNPSTDAVHFLIHVVDPSGERVQLRLFDPSGRVIADIADGSFPSGDTVISWPRVTRNGDRVAPGYYESIGTIGSANVRERLILLP
ncbi:MAG TPA: hypothetical protein VEU09_11710 [Candidatus Binatia bacterium]|nr:hypothetical protein [Candidatus Binatia bacterium]